MCYWKNVLKGHCYLVMNKIDVCSPSEYKSAMSMTKLWDESRFIANCNGYGMVKWIILLEYILKLLNYALNISIESEHCSNILFFKWKTNFINYFQIKWMSRKFKEQNNEPEVTFGGNLAEKVPVVRTRTTSFTKQF